MADRFKGFSSNEKYYYTDISKPNQDYKTKFNNFWMIFKDNNYRRNYISDCKNLKYKEKCSNEEKNRMIKYYKFYKFSDILIFAFISNSFYRHYTNKYFSTNSRLIDIYIVSKLSIYILLFFSVKFFLMKTYSDPILYNYYSIVEYENALYSSNLLKSNKDLDEIKLSFSVNKTQVVKEKPKTEKTYKKGTTSYIGLPELK